MGARFCGIVAALALFILAGFLMPAMARAQSGPPEPPAAPVLALLGGRWFDDTGFTRRDWYAVDGRLTEARPARIDVTVDLAGRYVLPPLADAHNHDLQGPAFIAQSVERNLREGVFYSVQMCAKPNPSRSFSRLLNTPGTIDVLYADACISASDGHPLGMALAGFRQSGAEVTVETARLGYDAVDSVEDLDRVWPEILARQPRLIKIILVNSEVQEQLRADPGTFGFRGLDLALVRPIVERAHAAGIRVAAHVDSAWDFGLAVISGVDLIAHLPGLRFAPGRTAFNYRISEEVIAAAARQGTVVVTTAGIAPFWYAGRPDSEIRVIEATLVDNLSRLRAAGVPLAIGSDNVRGTVIDEILYLDRLQVMPRAELLRRSVMETPRLLFPDRSIGTFAEGAEASLVAFDSDPVEDLRILRRPAVRIKQGVILGR